MQTNLNAKSQSGSSLISVVIGIGILGAATLILAKIDNFSTSASNHSDLDLDRVILTRMLLNATDCKESLKKANCTVARAGANVDLWRRSTSGSLTRMISSSGTRYGKLSLLARCSSDRGINVRVARLKPGVTPAKATKSDFLKDPLNGKKISYTDLESLILPDGFDLCTEETPDVTLKYDSEHFFSVDNLADFTSVTGSCGNSVFSIPASSDKICLLSGSYRRRAVSDCRLDRTSAGWEVTVAGCFRSGADRKTCRYICYTGG